MAFLFGLHFERGGEPPLGVFELLNRFVMAADIVSLSEGQALYLLPELTKDPVKRDLYRMLSHPALRAGSGEISTSLGMVNSLLMMYASECSLSDMDMEFHAASQREEGEDENEFFEKLMDLHALCGYIHTTNYVRSRFLQGLSRKVRFSVRIHVAHYPSFRSRRSCNMHYGRGITCGGSLPPVWRSSAPSKSRGVALSTR